jgi:hypothetical protein
VQSATADQLLAGSALTHAIALPPSVLAPAAGDDASAGEDGAPAAAHVRMRPLTVRDVQLCTKAARDDDTLLSLLMLKAGLVEPALSLEQAQSLPAGLARFLVDELNRISGLTVDEDSIRSAVDAPLARACFVLAREFGWSPEEVGELTVGQVLLYLEMLDQGRAPVEA